MLDALGVDIGGVVISHVGSGNDTSFFAENYLETPSVPKALESLRMLRARFGSNIYLVSKAKSLTQNKTVEWMRYHQFHVRTGIEPKHVLFCLERSEKAGICERLGITHFVDDKLEVLSHMTTVPFQFLFQGKGAEMARFYHHLEKVKKVETWQEILNELLPDNL